jgi:hypothetical protein
MILKAAAYVAAFLQVPLPFGRHGRAASVGVNYRYPPREYITAASDANAIWVEKELHDNDPELETKAVERLRKVLALIKTCVPVGAAAELASPPIILLYGEKATAGGRPSGARYFSKSAPDRDASIDPRWGHCIVIWSAANYLKQSDLWAAKLIMHELAHSFQLGRYPERQPDLMAAYRHALGTGLYRNVESDKGRTIEKAYALANHLEYFAELSAVYFVGANYFPFDKTGLERYDPQGYALVEMLWGIRPPRER